MLIAEQVYTLVGEASDSIDRAHEGDVCRRKHVAKSGTSTPAQSGAIGEAKEEEGEIHLSAKSVCTARTTIRINTNDVVTPGEARKSIPSPPFRGDRTM